MQDPKLLYHQKALQWLNNYTSRVLREYSQNDRHSLQNKKGKKEVSCQVLYRPWIDQMNIVCIREAICPCNSKYY